MQTNTNTISASFTSLSTKTRDRIIGWMIGIACAAPAIFLVVAFVQNKLGVNPFEALVRQSGVWGLRLLLLTLAISPIAKMLRQPWIARQRRTIGLWAFALVSLHLVTFVVIDKELDWAEIWSAIIKRPYITIGMGAFLLLIPLAITSFDALRRKMPPKNWRRLHQLIYLIAIMGVAHYYLLVKADRVPPIIYGLILASLLAWRWHHNKRRANSRS